jgi:hypothetical protein
MIPPPSRFARRLPVSIAGNHGFLGVDTNEHGAFRIDWLDAAGYHSIIMDRIITPQGLSGIGRGEMLRMARSLYQ